MIDAEMGTKHRSYFSCWATQRGTVSGGISSGSPQTRRPISKLSTSRSTFDSSQLLCCIAYSSSPNSSVTFAMYASFASPASSACCPVNQAGSSMVCSGPNPRRPARRGN
eukprot:TRINITY_DN18582_c0_g1_i2.p2 TRINITY_DN18582_c0_g1~~TRINITY_DN18582_c0_g1_i2.p2  ORF type:complete len:110 (-),score=9.76 TRINITY_DN18582_c0_g1_i2:24-353(-)